MLVLAVACIGTCLRACARSGWICELASHFPRQYAGLSALAAIGLALAKEPGAALAGLALAGVNLVPVLALYRKVDPAESGEAVRVLLANVLTSNDGHGRVVQLIREAQPDLIILIEINARWQAALEVLGQDYPFGEVIPLPDGYGLMLRSRRPLEALRTRQFGNGSPPALVARLRVGGRPLLVIAIHPRSPITPAKMRRRDAQLRAVAEFIAQQPEPVILVGDLNTTSWSPIFTDLLGISGLRDSRMGFGPQPTWPVRVPLARIPLDHCLVPPGVHVRSRRIGPDIGSDHYAVLADLVIIPSSGSDAPAEEPAAFAGVARGLQ